MAKKSKARRGIFYFENADGTRRYYFQKRYRGKDYLWPDEAFGDTPPWREAEPAERRRTAVNAAMKHGTFEEEFGHRRDRTLREAMGAYLDTNGVGDRQWTTDTRESYEQKAAHILEWKFAEGHPLAGRPLGDYMLGQLIDPGTRDSYLGDFREHRRREGTSDRTINRQITLLRGACEYAKRLWRLRHNPAENLRTVNERSRAVGSYPDAELVENVLIPRLRDDMNDPRSPYAYSMFLVVYDCGLRAGDAKRLRPEQVDLERDVLVVPTGKTGNIAMPPISARLREVLVPLMEENGHTGWVFPDLRTGKPYVKGPVRVWRRLMGEVPGLAQYRVFHDWRHSFTSRASEAGIPEAVIARYRGDADTSMLARYRHMRPEAIVHWRDALHERDAAYRNGRLVNLGSRRRQVGTDVGTSRQSKTQTSENSA